MECNKDEACRAKEIAEEKMLKNDFEGARKIALKAKQLFPELDNVSQLIAVCDIHCSAQKKIYGAEKDLYGILQVENLADETTIRKQYRKLALVLHPDKNKFPGAEAAFKLIGEANTILSDTEKRSVYDSKCRESTRTSVKKVQKSQGNQTSNADQNKFKNALRKKFNGSNQSASNPNIRVSFWTCCPFCNIRYEYYREFVNRALKCQHCLKNFIGYEIGVQGGTTGPGFVNENMQSANLGSKPVFQQKDAGKQEKVKVNIKKDGQFSSSFAHKKTKDTEVSAGSRTNTKQEGVTTSKVNVQKPVETETNIDMNRKRGRKPRAKSNGSSSGEREVAGGGVSGDPGGNSVDQRRPQQSEHVSCCEDADDELSSQKRSKPRKSSVDTEYMKKEHVSSCEDTSNVSISNGKHKVKGEEAEMPDIYFESDSEPELVDCPDQEFCNFDKNKEEHCFAVDQIWACYDSVDGMPRFYAQIRKIYSPEFRLRFTWLEAEPEDDLEIRWAEEGLPVACGKFVPGETEETRDRLMFSHLMVCNKKGESNCNFSYVIGPQKGEIWALFKDWDIKWSLDPECHKKFKFDIVEILLVHNGCVSVAFLSKVKGFVSVFQRITWEGVAEHRIPSNERFRFSHRIPFAKLTGTERAGVPTGSYELDMASLPGDLEDYCYSYNVNMASLPGDLEDYCYSYNVNMASQSHEEKVKPTTNFAHTPKKNTNGLDKDVFKLRRSPRGVKSQEQEHTNPCPMPGVGLDKANDGQNSFSECGMQTSHDFRSDKQIWKFQVGQIWAFWERGNEIRQCYAQIKHIEYQQLRLHVSLLKQYDMSCSGYNACGLFKVSAGKPKILAVDSFSHILEAEPCSYKIFNIYPRKHQMWALSKRQEAGGCEIVEVVETDKVSIKVMSLTRVPGFTSVFKAPVTQSSAGNIVVIPRVELNRFSHQIPAFYFTDGCLRGCWELDPAALTGCVEHLSLPL